MGLKTTETMHAFERSGCGRAPFRFVAVERRVGPIKIGESNGCEHWCGAPGQPMGTCAHCGTAIAECCLIQDADGKTFIVGNVCVGKTGDVGLISLTKHAVAKLRREAKHAQDDRRIEEARLALACDAVAGFLANQSHPVPYMDDQGKTLLDWCWFMLERAGRTGGVKAARKIEAAVETVREDIYEGRIARAEADAERAAEIALSGGEYDAEAQDEMDREDREGRSWEQARLEAYGRTWEQDCAEAEELHRNDARNEDAREGE